MTEVCTAENTDFYVTEVNSPSGAKTGKSWITAWASQQECHDKLSSLKPLYRRPRCYSEKKCQDLNLKRQSETWVRVKYNGTFIPSQVRASLEYPFERKEDEISFSFSSFPQRKKEKVHILLLCR